MNIQERLNRLNGKVSEGVRVVTAPHLFPTPPELARRMVELACIQEGDTVLEPSAGTGNILEAIISDNVGLPVAVEINQDLCNILQNRFPITVINCMDFLQFGRGRFPVDKIIMNPPFNNGEDIKHIKHALTMLKDGGTLVAICANGPRQRDQLMNIADYWEDLPSNTFKQAGTSVNTALLIITK